MTSIPNANSGFPVQNHEGRPARCTPGIEPRECDCCPGGGDNASGKFTVTIAGTELGSYGTKPGCTCNCACTEDVDGTYEFDIPAPWCGDTVDVDLNDTPGDCEWNYISVSAAPACRFDAEFGRDFYWVDISAALVRASLGGCVELEFWEVNNLITNDPPINQYLEGDCFTGTFTHPVNRASGHGFPAFTDETQVCPRCYAKKEGTISVQFHNA